MTQRKWLAECHAWIDDPQSVQWQTESDDVLVDLIAGERND